MLVPADGVLSPWSDWMCLESCGDTVEFRNRTCDAPDDLVPGCPFDCGDALLSEQVECNNGCCDRKLALNASNILVFTKIAQLNIYRVYFCSCGCNIFFCV